MTRKSLAAPFLALALLTTSSAQAPAAPEAFAGFESFVQRTAPVCVGDASTRCFERGFSFADADGDGLLSLAEAERLRELTATFARVHWERLDRTDRTALALGLWIVDYLGIEALFASYDSDGDGFLSPEELAADIRLDERPLAAVLQDREAFDRQRFAARLGGAARLLEGLWPTAAP